MVYKNRFGFFTYGQNPPRNNYNPPVTYNTLWDMASCSKVLGATQAIAQFYQRGEISLNDTIVKYLGEDFAQYGKGPITILNCLLHNSGFPPDPTPNFWDPKFPCPQNTMHAPPESFECQSRLFEGLLNQTLINPIGSKYVYSDLSLITLMYVVGNLAQNFGYVQPSELRKECYHPGNTRENYQCYFETYVNKYVFKALNMTNTGFLPTEEKWPNCAPTWNITSYYREGVMQGQVSDGNAFVLGGIAGHAGVFSTLDDTYNFMIRQMYPPEKPDLFALNATTLDLFHKEYNHSQSSRALGWNTNDPDAFDCGWSLDCGNLLSPQTYMHIGYTGTLMCGDPVNEIITIFHTNRVYPNTSNEQIQNVRRAFGNTVKTVIDSLYGKKI